MTEERTMLRYRLKHGRGRHYGKFVVETSEHEATYIKNKRRIMPGDIILVESADDLGNAKDKFELVDEGRRVRVKRTRGGAKVETEPAPDEPEEGMEPEVELKAIHKGGGRFIVVNEETGEQIHDDYLTKADAEALINKKITLTTEEGAE